MQCSVVRYSALWCDAHMQIDSSTHMNERMDVFYDYGVATISRLLQMLGLFCKRALYKRLYSAIETYNFKEPTNRSHPIVAHM